MTFRSQAAQARHAHQQKANTAIVEEIVSYHQGYADGITHAQLLYEQDTLQQHQERNAHG